MNAVRLANARCSVVRTANELKKAVTLPVKKGGILSSVDIHSLESLPIKHVS